MDIINEDGEIIHPQTVEYAYTRDGRKEIGKEYPNPIPMELPLGQQPYEDIWVTIKRMVLEHARVQAQAENDEEMETEEEADDFDVGDDYDPTSPWEENHEPTDPWPLSTAARQLEQAIAEKRNASRIATLKQELEALQNGQEWPPAQPGTTPTGQPSSPMPAPGEGA